MEEIVIKDKTYHYIINYTNDPQLRNSLNQLTHQIYGFDFERWYQSGYWTNNCIPYSIIDNGKVVSNICVNIIDFIILGEKKHFIQLGTVMTHPEYRNQGLSAFLMQKVLTDYDHKCHMIYLFANDSVLDFYPKFDFVPAHEYQAVKQIQAAEQLHEVKKMNIDDPKQSQLFEQLVMQSVPQSKLSMQNNIALILFYCKYFDLHSFKDDIYYIEDLKAIIIATYDGGDQLTIYDIFASQEVDINQVINTLATHDTQQVVLKYTPLQTKGFDLISAKEEDSTLFVRINQTTLFENNKLIFPTLSHT